MSATWDALLVIRFPHSIICRWGGGGRCTNLLWEKRDDDGDVTLPLLFCRGEIDDVVVMQHNLALVKKFVDLGIQMEFFPYPMHPHNVMGKDRVHLMEKVLKFVIEHNK